MALDQLDPQDREVLYELYALGLLDPADMAEVRSLLEAGDPATTLGVSQALELTSAIGYLAPDKKPSPALRRRLMLASGAPERGLGWRWILGLAAATAVLSVVVWNIRQDVSAREARILALEAQLKTANTQLAQAQDLYDFLRQPSTIGVKFGDTPTAPPRGQVFVNRDRGVLLLAANLPPMPAGQIFEMWLVPKGGAAPVPAGLFRAEAGQGVHYRSGPVDLPNLAAIAVTLEPEAGSTTPTPPILFAAPIPGE
ncbi:MAG: anti-sigma factor [Bryobacter sp.]|nr:anti-sigma factor [Bryobacter sp.]